MCGESAGFSTVEEVLRTEAEALRQREDEAKLAALRAAGYGDRTGEAEGVFSVEAW
jgi:hypothetical protein